MSRPSWDVYFLNLAKVISERSHDPHTKHGCLIVKDNRPLGFGYNGFPKGMDDESLPLTRPEKYPWMIHSEINALASCEHRPIGATAYITGPPCHNCLITMYQFGITKIVHGNLKAKMIDEEQERNKSIFLNQIQIEIIQYEF